MDSLFNNIQVINSKDIPNWKGIEFEDFRDWLQEKIIQLFSGESNTPIIRDSIKDIETDFINQWCFDNQIDKDKIKLIVDEDNPLYLIMFPKMNKS